ncbi:MAG: penicillin-binding protein [Paludibacteraceae bacterium]|nr:penicillin-binding protein [Paludibacteraceae bacterium]
MTKNTMKENTKIYFQKAKTLIFKALNASLKLAKDLYRILSPIGILLFNKVKSKVTFLYELIKKYGKKFIHLFKSKWQVKALVLAGPPLVFLLFVTLFIYAVDGNWFGWFGASPNSETLDKPIQVEASEIYSADGVMIGKYFTENRSSVDFKGISPILIETLVHTEDERFYEHHGVDYWGIVGAFKDAIFGNARGASTITQQLVKNLFKIRSEYMDGKLCKVSGFSTMIIKVKECLGARRIEDRYSKEQILNMYLNTVYFGSNAYGIKAAAKTYFNTTPDKLTYEQSACLVGILKANTYYNPKKNPENNLRRRNVILNLMHEQGVFSKQVCDSLCDIPLMLNFKQESNLNGKALYFRDLVYNELQSWCDENGVNLYQDGLKIYTTIDSRMQEYAESAVSKQMAELQKKFDQGWGKNNPWRDRSNKELKNFIDDRAVQTDAYKALSMRFKGNKDSIMSHMKRPHKMKVFDYKRGVKDTIMSSLDSLKYTLRFLHCGFLAMEPQTGYVKAWVGDVDYNYWQYDKVLAKRQPGSTFKLFVYAEHVRQGGCPCDVRVDSAVNWSYRDREDGKITLWQPKNANGEFSDEEMTLKTAFARSINSVAVQLTREIGAKNIVSLAHKMGIESDIEPNPSVCLGSEDVSLLEMITAYSVIADEGRKHKPIFVTRIEDKNGKVLYKSKISTETVLDYETAFLMREMLREGLVDEKGTSQGLHRYNIFQNTDFGGKTGSTSNYSDAWYIGISPNLVAGAWVGGEYRCIHFRNGAEGQGGRAALPIFGRFMEKTMNDKRLKGYRGRFEEPKQEISKMYACEKIEPKSEGGGVRGFWKRLFGKKDPVINEQGDTVLTEREIRRRERKAEKEAKRAKKEQEKAEKAEKEKGKKKWWKRNRE